MMETKGLFSRNPTIGDEGIIDRSIPKIVALAIFGVIFSFAFGYFLDDFLDNQNIQSLIISLAGLSGFLIIFLFQSLFIKFIWYANLIIFFESVGILVGFYKRISSPLIASVTGLMFLILLWANWSGHKELENMIKIKFWRISKVVLPKAIAAVALFNSILLIFPAFPLSTDVYKLPFSSDLFEQLIVSASGVVQKFIPGFDLSLPVGKLAINLAEEQAKNSPEFQALSPSLKQQVINKTAKDFEAKIADIFGADINLKMTISDIAYKAVSDKFFQLPENIKNLVLIGIILLIFLTIEGFAIPLRWLVSVVAFVIYEILFITGFATKMIAGESKEIIVLN